MGKLGTIIRATLLGGAMYAAGVFSSNAAQEIGYRVTHPKTAIEQGYCADFGAVHKQRVINEAGNLETYIVGPDDTALPCYDGKLGLQVGDPNYIVGNLTEAQKSDLSNSFYDGLNEERKVGVVLENFDELCPEAQETLASGVLQKHCDTKWEQFKQMSKEWWDSVTE